MSTARQVVDPWFASPATATADPERAAVRRPTLAPRVPLQWWWGDAGSAIASGTPKAAAPAPAGGATGPGGPSGGGGCCG